LCASRPRTWFVAFVGPRTDRACWLCCAPPPRPSDSTPFICTLCSVPRVGRFGGTTSPAGMCVRRTNVRYYAHVQHHAHTHCHRHVRYPGPRPRLLPCCPQPRLTTPTLTAIHQLRAGVEDYIIIRAGRCVRRACVCERVCQRASVHLSCVRELARASWCVRVYESARLRRRVSLCQSVMRCSQCLLRVAWPGLDHHAQAADSTEPSLVHHRMTVHAKQAGTRHQVARHVWLGLWCAFARSLPPPHEGDDFDSADSDSDHGPSARPASLCKTRRKWNRYSARAWRQGAGWFLASTELVVNIMYTSINTSMGPRHLLPLSNDGTTAPSQNHRHVAFIQ
jgi:hypothetical protein